jgi:signal transduction histidine kinase
VRRLRRLINLGGEFQGTPRARRHLVIANSIALATVTVCVLYVGMASVQGMPASVIAPMCGAALLVMLSFALNAKGFFTAGRCLLLTVANGAILLYRVWTGTDAGADMFYPLVCMPLVVASLRERRLIIYGVSLTVVCAVGWKAYLLPRVGAPLLTPDQARTLLVGTVPMTLFLLLWVVWSFKVSNDRAEAALEARSRELEQSLDALGKTQRALMELSRKSGMADVASSVLHGVGNVLTSVNVSVGQVRDALRNSKVGNIGKASQLLRTHEADLPAFLQDDPRGKLLPQYLVVAAEAVAKEHGDVERELDSLERNISHINAIVAAQQEHGQFGGVIESVRLADLLEDAIRLSSAMADGAGLTWKRDFADLPEVHTDRHKVLQIVLSLLSNAIDAVSDPLATERAITLRTRLDGDDAFVIVVADTGSGIAAENLTQVFTHGFTTKPDGRGFGLHSSANAAAEMSGSLATLSPGIGQGATFTLRLPRHPAGVTRRATDLPRTPSVETPRTAPAPSGSPDARDVR